MREQLHEQQLREEVGALQLRVQARGSMPGQGSEIHSTHCHTAVTLDCCYLSSEPA